MPLQKTDNEQANQRHVTIDNPDRVEIQIHVGKDGVTGRFVGTGAQIGRAWDTMVSSAKAAGNAFLRGITLIDAGVVCVIDANSAVCRQMQDNVDFVMSLSDAKVCERNLTEHPPFGGSGVPADPTAVMGGAGVPEGTQIDYIGPDAQLRPVRPTVTVGGSTGVNPPKKKN